MTRDAEERCALPLNQLAPRRMMVGATATVSTLATVVGQPKKTEISRERWLESGFALFAFEGFDQSGFFTANVGSGALRNVDVKVVA